MGLRAYGRHLRGCKLHDPKPLSTLLNVPEIVLGLLVEPALGGRVEGHGESNCHFRADPGAAIQDRGERLPADPQSFRSLRNGDAERLEAQSLDDLSRMGWIVHAHRDSSQW